jgi:PEGA domain
MNQRRHSALLAGLLFVALCANAGVNNNIRIKVLDSETRSVSLEGGDVPKNCDQVNFDAYCHNSKTSQVTNTLLVQEGNNPPFRVSCNIDSKWSRCIPLPKGESFDAKREKRGLEVYYIDDKGKARSQLYAVVSTDGKTSPPATAAAVATQPAPAAVAPRQSSPAPTPAPSVGSAQATMQEATPQKVEKVKCNFSSTPPGAEIALDGKYMGSTPSEIPVSTGTHVVIFSLPGFAEWKRELTVEAGSVVNVTASLQKRQP